MDYRVEFSERRFSRQRFLLDDELLFDGVGLLLVLFTITTCARLCSSAILPLGAGVLTIRTICLCGALQGFGFRNQFCQAGDYTGPPRQSYEASTHDVIVGTFVRGEGFYNGSYFRIIRVLHGLAIVGGQFLVGKEFGSRPTRGLWRGHLLSQIVCRSPQD